LDAAAEKHPHSSIAYRQPFIDGIFPGLIIPQSERLVLWSRKRHPLFFLNERLIGAQQAGAEGQEQQAQASE
jgi:hypothetical protein